MASPAPSRQSLPPITCLTLRLASTLILPALTTRPCPAPLLGRCRPLGMARSTFSDVGKDVADPLPPPILPPSPILTSTGSLPPLTSAPRPLRSSLCPPPCRSSLRLAPCRPSDLPPPRRSWRCAARGCPGLPTTPPPARLKKKEKKKS